MTMTVQMQAVDVVVVVLVSQKLPDCLQMHCSDLYIGVEVLKVVEGLEENQSTVADGKMSCRQNQWVVLKLFCCVAALV